MLEAFALQKLLSFFEQKYQCIGNEVVLPLPITNTLIFNDSTSKRARYANDALKRARYANDALNKWTPTGREIPVQR